MHRSRAFKMDPEHGDLVRPCGCRGSQAYVHAECLWRWREQSASRARCELCGCCFTVAGPATAEARAAALLAAGLLGVVTVDVALLVLEVCGLSVPQVTRCARFTPAWRRGIESLWQACDADGDGFLSTDGSRDPQQPL
ncbi:unnamed protein product [Prorocentrum cordatum]|uniref:RING-CH-type domain-containing protein n=1 Tax=Prorocentrum cordatum TaxID=2364126 RepID=A0ABN9Y1L6_9DINO|nr:unnamed protein product [Polarella glacialis]